MQREMSQVESAHPWVLLMQLDIQGGLVSYRIANYDQPITFHGFQYLAFPLDCDALEDASSAGLVHLRVTAANVDQTIQALLENYWRADPDWRCTVWQVDATMPDETPYEAGEVFTVASVTTDLVTASFDLIAEGITLTKTIPGRRYCSSSGFPSIPRR
jgi:hypothetical protein